MQEKILFFLLFLPFLIFSQELPPVINFNPNQYQAGNQNWMVAQSPEKTIYVANSSGLLEFSGSEWNLYPMPNNSVVRSLEVVGDRIYTGAYMEIGYWTRNEKGFLEYQSLLPNFPGDVRDGEQFWHMEHVGNILIFQSFEGLYLFNTDTEEFSRLKTPPELITNLFKGENSIYFQVINAGLFTVKSNKPELVIPPEFLMNVELMHVDQKGDELDLISRTGKFYKWDGNQLEQVNKTLTEKMKNKSVLKALTLEDNSLVIGTGESGIYYIKEGEILHHFNQENGLANNTVLALYEDEEENIWVGLDNGLSIINLDSPYKLYHDIYGSLGSVYASYQTQNELYLGTNQGLFYRKIGEDSFNFVEGTNGQVWNLQFIDGNLFCGHNNGTYLIQDGTAKRIFDYSGTWMVTPLNNKPGFYLQGHYNGISVLEKVNGVFEIVGVLKDFPHSSKFILSEPNGDIWVGNEHKGVFKFRLKESKTETSSLKNYPFEGMPGITSSIFKFNDTIYYSAKDQLFQYQENIDKFTGDSKLGNIFKEAELISGKVIKTGDKIWGFSRNTIFNVQVSQLSSGYKLNSIYLTDDLRNITLGYENITELKDGNYLLGVSNGYFKFENLTQQTSGYTISINRVSRFALDKLPEVISLKGEHLFHHKENNVNISYSIPEYKKYLTPIYSYRLLGLSPNWSAWTPTPVANFKNLSFGEYEFQVKGQIGDQAIAPVTFVFQIARPWYLSYLAIAIYFILFLILIYLVNKVYKKRHLRLIKENEKELRMKNLEAEKKIVELQNEQLERDMNTKNKELAISTMSLVKKNEFLSNIKEKLQTSTESGEVRSVIRTIDKDINEEDNWKIFKDAFNNADKDFFKKIKSHHPNLTSNDLKLCAYLRLNLSSKEIAPLLNISVKSVEIKRYRLRKKMDLPHEIHLTEYILEI